MKISKVDHTKSAVSVQTAQGQQGILYKDPSTEEMSVEDRVTKRADATKALYAVFNQPKDKRSISGEATTVASSFNYVIKDLKKSKSLNGKLSVESLYEAVGNELKGKHASAEEIDLAITLLLKKSLRRDSFIEALKLVLGKAYKGEKLNEEDKRIIKDDLIVPLIKDYDKSSIREQAVASIKHQNLIAQPDSKSDDAVMVISNIAGASERSTNEKEALRQFISEYAVLDDSVRHDMRVKLRRLVILYFYGMDVVPTGDFDEWEDHVQRGKTADLFIDFAPVGGKTDADRLKDAIRKMNIERYRYSVDAIDQDNTELFFEDMMINKFFIHHIENEVERIYRNTKPGDEFKRSLGYISERVWKGIINYLCIKYIAIGKAVYNCAMAGLGSDQPDIKLGVIDRVYADGISSFDYEIIKAQETLQRETSVYVSFAINHLGAATVNLTEKETDFLTLDNKQIKELAKTGVLRNILQFFGGKSVWKNFEFAPEGGTGNEEIVLLYYLKDILYAMRNENFHFSTASINDGSWDTDLIGRMFAYDCTRAGVGQKNKFYSNNLPMFYKSEDLERALHILYDHYSERASQVPAFNTVFVRKNFSEILKGQNLPMPTSAEESLKYQNAIYYLYKEIYYNVFLSSSESRDYFIKAVKSLRWENSNEENAVKDFQNRINELTGKYSLSQICQLIMTEYNQQNSGSRKKKTAKDEQNKPDIFKHYKMLLYKSIREAMLKYVDDKSEDFGFIKSPVFGKDDNCIALEEFLPDYESTQNAKLIERVKSDFRLQKWYILGRLLNPKQVNQLAGSIRSYIQYSDDVKRRAKENGNKIHVSTESYPYQTVLRVIDLCAKLSGLTTNNIDDYFDGSGDYLSYLARFVEYDPNDIPKIYHDEANPILNRNIIMAKLYGAGDVITNAVEHVNTSMIRDLESYEKKTLGYRSSGVCKDKDEQETLKKYQELKNRVELREIVECSEIINELQGQLINWCYLRERDLMYFQLGFHYTCLKNSSDKPEMYVKAKTVDGTIDGFILHQIAALYTNGLKLYSCGKAVRDDNRKIIHYDLSSGKELKGNDKSAAGKKITDFMGYTSLALNRTENDILPISGDFYYAGLELFENVNEHENIISLRNYIDHFHYYAKHDRSMIDIYSEVFDRFFSYDMKYRKNVPNMMYNILLSHFVKAQFVFGSGMKESGEKTKSQARFDLKDKAGLEPEQLTYKVANSEKPVQLSAKDKQFLKTVALLLYYPEKKTFPEGMYADTRFVEGTSSNKRNNNSSGNRHGNGNHNVGGHNKGYNQGRKNGNWSKDKSGDRNAGKKQTNKNRKDSTSVYKDEGFSNRINIPSEYYSQKPGKK